MAFSDAPPVTRAPAAGKGLALTLRGLLPFNRYGSGPATMGQTLVADGRGGAAFRTNSAVALSNSANQVIPTGTWTSVTFDTEKFDTDTMHEGSTHPSRITCNTAGIYICGGGWEIATSTASFDVRVFLNNTSVVAFTQQNSSVAQNVMCTGMVQLAAGDYIELQAFQTSGGNLNSQTEPYAPLFWASKVG